MGWQRCQMPLSHTRQPSVRPHSRRQQRRDAPSAISTSGTSEAGHLAPSRLTLRCRKPDPNEACSGESGRRQTHLKSGHSRERGAGGGTSSSTTFPECFRRSELPGIAVPRAALRMTALRCLVRVTSAMHWWTCGYAWISRNRGLAKNALPSARPIASSTGQNTSHSAGAEPCGRIDSMGERPRHPIKEWEALIRRAEVAGWRATRRKNYFHIWCPCGQHHRSIPLTPSVGGTLLNVSKWLERQSCWKEV